MKAKKRNQYIIFSLSIIVIILGSLLIKKTYSIDSVITNDQNIISESKNSNKIVATIYRSPSCGCCGNYATFLKKNGFDVTIKNMDDLSGIKEQYNIPINVQSCHTTIIGDYFIEGHMPIEAINKMLLEKPEIDGIALPGMPSGSPGMPGAKQGDFTIYSVLEGKTSEYLTQ